MITGMNAATGRRISDWDHLVQSLGKVLTTTLSSRVMRRYFGATQRVDSPISPTTLLDFYANTAKALKFEPRFRASRISVDGSNAAAGQVFVKIEGVYYPNALVGDYSVAVPQIAAIPLS